MPCKNCIEKPVYVTLTNIKLCKNCFIKYFEKKVFKTISKFKLIKPNDKLLVGFSGGKDSTTILYLLKKYKEKFPFEIEAIIVDEGIKDYRSSNLKNVKDFCKSLNIKLNITSYQDFFGFRLDNLIKKVKKKDINYSACRICGTLRRYLFNKFAKKNGFTKVVTGHNLDDEAQNVLLNVYKNNYGVLKRLGPITQSNQYFVQKIKPLYLLTEKEVTIYTVLNDFKVDFTRCPNSEDSFRKFMSDQIDNVEDSYNGSKNSIVQFLLNLKEDISFLKEDENIVLKKCKICKEASQKEICSSCFYKNLFFD